MHSQQIYSNRRYLKDHDIKKIYIYKYKPLGGHSGRQKTQSLITEDGKFCSDIKENLGQKLPKINKQF